MACQVLEVFQDQTTSGEVHVYVPSPLQKYLVGDGQVVQASLPPIVNQDEWHVEKEIELVDRSLENNSFHTTMGIKALTLAILHNHIDDVTILITNGVRVGDHWEGWIQTPEMANVDRSFLD